MINRSWKARARRTQPAPAPIPRERLAVIFGRKPQAEIMHQLIRRYHGNVPEPCERRASYVKVFGEKGSIALIRECPQRVIL